MAVREHVLSDGTSRAGCEAGRGLLLTSEVNFKLLLHIQSKSKHLQSTGDKHRAEMHS